MKNFFSKQAAMLIAGALTSLSMRSQNYTWEKGPNTTGQAGVYGTIGVAAAANNPSARTQSANWKDAAGNFWLFGGVGVATNGTALHLNDLWKYNPLANQWTFVGGSQTGDPSGNYGTIHVAAATNVPGGRSASVCWTDQAGNFWIFGGYGVDQTGATGELNDLWKYNVTTGQWTWMSGDSNANIPGTYGTLGTAAAANTPGSRDGSCGWSDAAGNLWLFAGWGIDNTSNLGSLGDLWKYNIASGQWTWIKGVNSISQNGTYGTLGTAAAANMPGGRSFSGTWTDASGNLWLQGGAGYPASGGLTILADFWKYNPTSNQWTWVGGMSTFTTSPIGAYGTQGVASSSNIPGGRGSGGYLADGLGNLWQLGGSGYGAGHSSPVSGNMNDLWKYSIAANQWTWVKGSDGPNAPGVYGTQGTAAALNTPGARYAVANWTDSNGALWFFGGYGNATTAPSGAGYLSDLWKFQPCVNQTLSIQGANTICAGSSATLTAGGASSYSWSTQQTATSIVVSPGSTTAYTVQSADPTSCGGSVSATLTVNPLPPVDATSSKSLACDGESVTITASGALTYSWSSGQTGAGIQVAATNTTYTVNGTSANGCTKTTTVAQQVNACTGIRQQQAASPVSVYPNPTDGRITISSASGNTKDLQVVLYNALGKHLSTFAAQNGDALEINFTAMNLESGIYFISISNNGVMSNQKIIYTSSSK